MAANQAAGTTPVLRPTLLTKRGTDVLIRIEHLMDEAGKALAAAGPTVSELPTGPADASTRSDAVASASNGGAVRGN